MCLKFYLSFKELEVITIIVENMMALKDCARAVAGNLNLDLQTKT